MTVPDWERIEPLLAALLELPRDAHEDYVRRECAGDPALAEQVLALVADELPGAGFLEHPANAAGGGDEAGDVVGRYRLLAVLGTGGMGAVWLAERADGAFEQRVALKRMHRGLLGRGLLERFEAERQVLAWLDHPGIARLIDGGVDDDGRPFLAMEYVEGSSIGEHCERAALDVPARLALFTGVCEAVEHAHARGVVHRDLKPTNILVDTDGRPRLLDFGIAKVLGAEDEDESFELTRTGQRLYSPLYASPEQVRGEAVTAASDVYALGIVLCELLSGCRPYDARTSSQLELERVVCEARPRAPSALVSSGDLRRALSGDLDWIVATALRKEPERRYASVGALRADLERHLAREPVLARPDSIAYRTRSYVRRNRAAVGGALGVVAALVVGLVLSWTAWRRAAESEREQRWGAYAAALQAAEASIRGADVAAARAQLASTPVELRGWEWRHLTARLDRSRRSFRLGTWARHSALSLAGDATHGFAVGNTRTRRLWKFQLRDGAIVVETELPPCESGDFSAWSTVEVHPSGEWVVVALGAGELGFFATSDLTELRRLRVGKRHVYSARYSPDGELLACGLRGGDVAVFSADGERELARWRAHGTGDLDLAFSADGRRLATASWDEHVRVWSVPDFELEHDLVGHARHVTHVAFAAQDTALVSTSIDGTARVWPLDDPSRALVFHGHRTPVEAVASHPDGRSVFTSGRDGSILRWELETGTVLAELRGHTRTVQSLAVAGSELVSLSEEAELRAFDLSTEDTRTLEGCEYQRFAILHPREEELAVAGPDGCVRRWSLPDYAPLPTLEAEERPLGILSYTEDGKHLAALDGELTFFRWNLEGDPSLRVTRPDPESERAVRAWAFDPRGRCAWVWCTSGELLHYDTQSDSGRAEVAVREGPGPGGSPARTCVDQRGNVLLYDPVHARIRVIDTATGVEHRPPLPTQSDPRLLWTAGDERLFALGQELTLWRGNERVWSSPALGGEIASVALHHGAERAVAGLQQGALVVVEATRGLPLMHLDGHTDAVRSLLFSADGGTLYSCSADGTLRVWDTQP